MPDSLEHPLPDKAELNAQELLDLCAHDPIFYSKHFFPKTCRQPFANFEVDVWDALENPANRYVNLQMFRGSAKTTRLRLFTSRRVAYAVSKTILYIGKSEGHAIRSLRWIKRNVEFNTAWSQFYGLRKGDKWTDTEIEIIHDLIDEPIWIMAMGITGSVRGLNQDDYRPDLIVIDDVVDDENSASAEQRNKIENLVYGAVMQSLAPRSESSSATVAMCQTPLNREDVSTKALDDPRWASLRFGCFNEAGESAWPARWTTEELQADKAAMIAKNQSSIWYREMECVITDPETAMFRSQWKRPYDIAPLGGVTCIAIDPVPPPSPKQVQQGLIKKDYEAFAVVRRFRNSYYILETVANRGHEPNWTVNTFFTLCLKYNPRVVVVESRGYQRTLKWLLTEAMKHRGQYWVIKESGMVDGKLDMRAKPDRINDALSGPASAGELYYLPEQTEFADQFDSYPNVINDDVLEAVAEAVKELSRTPSLNELEGTVEDDKEDKEFFTSIQSAWRGCP